MVAKRSKALSQIQVEIAIRIPGSLGGSICCLQYRTDGVLLDAFNVSEYQNEILFNILKILSQSNLFSLFKGVSVTNPLVLPPLPKDSPVAFSLLTQYWDSLDFRTSQKTIFFHT